MPALPRWAGTARVKDVRLWSGPEGTRLVIELTAPVEYDVFPLDNPTASSSTSPTPRSARKRCRPGRGRSSTALRAAAGTRPAPRARPRYAAAAKSFIVGPDGSAGHRLVVELPGKAAAVVAPAASGARRPVDAAAADTATSAVAMVADTAHGGNAPAAAAPAAAEPAPSSRRSSRLAPPAKGRDLVIAIDAGHGGQDPGAIGRGGTREKDVTLAIARDSPQRSTGRRHARGADPRRRLLHHAGGRTRKARQLGADMFVSIHADSVLKRDVSGSSVYVLSLRGASDEAARWLAESENAADLKGGVSLDGKDDLLASVLLDVTQKEAISDSVEAADNVLSALAASAPSTGARVRHAGFVVLKSPGHPVDAGRDRLHLECRPTSGGCATRVTSSASPRRSAPASATTGTTIRRRARGWPRWSRPAGGGTRHSPNTTLAER